MITYEITAEVEPASVEAYERYMRERHIPALLDTGCFEAASLSRAAPGRYRIRYETADQAQLDRYLGTHAAALRDDFALHFATGVSLSREVWIVIQRWDGRSTAPG
jgi:hypothetical protein